MDTAITPPTITVRHHECTALPVRNCCDWSRRDFICDQCRAEIEAQFCEDCRRPGFLPRGLLDAVEGAR